MTAPAAAPATHEPIPLPLLRPDIDLVDETLREGSERASVAIDLDEKAELGRVIAAAGLRSMVVGMFPDVPHNVELLRRLIRLQQRGSIARETRFLVISHVGETFRQTLAALHALDEPLDSVWIIAIHSVSDLQIRHLYPKILLKDPTARLDLKEWGELSIAERRRRNLAWLDRFLPEVRRYRGAGVMVGLLDAFRADLAHLRAAVDVVASHEVRQVRIVDTAGTCVPQQVPTWLDPLIAAHPEVSFYCHFHDDFGLGTANALLALGRGARGVDVAVGGFANRAGHPAVAEVAMALRVLHGVEVPGLDYAGLTALSRTVERTYGLMERATQPITGVITHAVQSGIRTELVGDARWIFDVIDPPSVGAQLIRSFGVRSGLDGMSRILALHAGRLREAGLEPTPELAARIYPKVMERWNARSDEVKGMLAETIARYHELLARASYTEDEVVSTVIELAAGAPGAEVGS